MRGNYIDFISAYCDRWCERCAFTTRCSEYAVEVATEMCAGDIAAGIELAIGAPPPQTDAERRRREEFLESLPNFEPTEAELEAYERDRQAREERIDELPIKAQSMTVTVLSRGWLKDNRERADLKANRLTADALDVLGWHSLLMATKLHRALDGRDRAQRGESWGDDHPIQNDWNGSAKVALISIVRSARAWEVIVQATGDSTAAHIASELRKLWRDVETVFPDVRKFIRPGFDQR